MDGDRIKKLLPFLKDVDFEDENNKRKVKFALMIFGVVLMFIVVVIAGMARKKPVKEVSAVDGAPEAAVTRDKGPRSGLLDLPEGEDQDKVLNSADMISARESQRKKRNSSLGDLYGRTSYGDEDTDPLSELTKDSGKTSALDEDYEATVMARREAELARRRKEESGAASAPSEPSYAPEKTRSVKSPSRTASASRPQATDPEEDPDMGLDPEPQPAPEPERKTVRKSGGISSLDDWGSVDGIGGLDNDEQYVVVDDDKPVKVMFVREQKVKNGSRVSLRLLDDIAADGMLIPKNTHVSAQCSISERLNLKVNNIEINGKIIMLGYTAFDNDGNEGLYCPQTTAAKNAKETKDKAMTIGQSLLQSAISGMGSSLPSQILSSGSSIIKNSEGNVEALVNAGYTFYLLKDPQERDAF